MKIGEHYIKGKREVVIVGFDEWSPLDVVFQEVGSERRSKQTKHVFSRSWRLKEAVRTNGEIV